MAENEREADDVDRDGSPPADEPEPTTGAAEHPDSPDQRTPRDDDEPTEPTDTTPPQEGDQDGEAFVFGDDSDESTSVDSAVTDSAPADATSEPADHAPFSSLADRVGAAARERADRDAAEEGDTDAWDLFDRESVTELDAARLWERLEHDDQAPTTDVQNRTIREVSKRAYCENCEHFSDPPEVACTHEGTTILELTDLETFTVANCPVVAEEEALEEST